MVEDVTIISAIIIFSDVCDNRNVVVISFLYAVYEVLPARVREILFADLELKLWRLKLSTGTTLKRISKSQLKRVQVSLNESILNNGFMDTVLNCCIKECRLNCSVYTV